MGTKRHGSDDEERRALLRNLSLIVSLLAGYLFVVSLASYHVFRTLEDSCGCVIPVPLILFLLSTLGLFVGTLCYYLLSSRFSGREREAKGHARAALAFLKEEERRIVESLIDGPRRQADLERLGLHRVQVHRLVRRLEERGVVEREREGNSLRVRLAAELAPLFR